MKHLPLIRNLLLSACLAVSVSVTAFALPPNLAHPILRDIVTGHAQDALNRLSGALAQHPDDAQAFELRCRVQIQEQQWNQAISSCREAVRLNPNDSAAHLWMGRAYGGKAGAASHLKALSLAVKLRKEFEKAVQLDPHDVAAYAALGDFYVEAPGMIGGGLGRAEALAAQLQSSAPATAHALLAKIAESRKNYPLAEEEWKKAVQTSTQPAEAWMDLAAFYRRRGELDNMVKAAETGASVNKKHGEPLVYGAEILMQAHRNLPEAEKWLREYLASPAQSEDAPAFVVRAKLAQLLQNEGKTVEAQQQWAASRALAPDYSPQS